MAYVLGNRNKEIQRLRLQAEFFEPFVTEALYKNGIKKGLTCADVGCGPGFVTRLLGDIVGNKGHVTGFDADPRYIKFCKRNNKQDNVSFVQENILEPKYDKQRFDIVYSRFMFVHLSDKKRALNSLKGLAKKGGIIIVQDLDHGTDSWLSYPKWECVEGLRRIFVKLIKNAGGDPYAGRKLYKLFSDSNLSDIKLDCYSPCIMTGKNNFAELGWRIAESLRPKIIEQGLLDKDGFESLYLELKQLARDKHSLVTYARFFSTSGVARGRDGNV